MDRASDRLTLTAAALARSSPTQWDDLLRELNALAATLADECVRAPLASVAISQGSARYAADLAKTFANCKSDAEKITQRKTK